MNCEQFIELLAEALGDELPPTVRSAFDAHLASCATCRREYQSLHDTVTTLRRLGPAPELSIQRQGESLVLGRSTDLRRSRTRRLSGLLRYAAIILLAFLAGLASRGGLGVAPDEGHVDEDAHRQVQPTHGSTGETIRTALVSAHRRHPGSTKLAKLLVALHSSETTK